MIEITGIEAIQAKLRELQQLGKNAKPLMAEVGNRVKNRIEQNFEEQGYYGDEWTQLKNPSAGFSGKRRGKRGKPLKRFMDYIAGRKILIDTGQLSKFTVQASNNEVIIGTNAAYGVYHQFGTKKMPARPFMPISSDGDMDSRMGGEIEAYLAAKIKKIID